MPLVRIDLHKGKDAAYRSKIGDVVYESLVTATGVPQHDRFQIIAEHDPANFLYDRTYLGIDRDDNFVVIQITLNTGRTLDQKKALYRAIAEGLHTALGLRMEDVFINLVEVPKENWSFGNGIAQYA